MPSDFKWMTGFECSAFPQIGADELEETEHYRWWASGLVRVREVGITMIRAVCGRFAVMSRGG
jgi:hypothetical protein